MAPVVSCALLAMVIVLAYQCSVGNASGQHHLVRGERAVATPGDEKVAANLRNYSIVLVLPVLESPVYRQVTAAVQLAIGSSSQTRLGQLGSRLQLGVAIQSYSDPWMTTSALASATQGPQSSVIAAVGLVSSGVARATVPVSQVTSLPMLTISAADFALTRGVAPNLFRMCPANHDLPTALIELIAFNSWTEVALLHSDVQFGSAFRTRFQELAAEKRIAIGSTANLDLSDIDQSNDIRSTLTAIKSTGTKIIVCSLALQQMLPLLTVAKQLGMLSASYAWIGTELTSGLGLLGSQLRSHMNGMLWLRPTIPDAAKQAFIARMEASFDPVRSEDRLSAESMYAYDAVSAVATALADCHSPTDATTTDGTLRNPVTLPDGVSLRATAMSVCVLSKLATVSLNSTTGTPIDLSERLSLLDQPATSGFDVLNVVQGKAALVGQWSSQYHLTMDTLQVITWPGDTQQVPSGRLLSRGFLRVLVPISAPFSSYPGAVEVVGDALSQPLDNYTEEKFEGIAVDALRRIAQMSGFTYKFYLYPYSSWTTMVALTGNKTSPWDLTIGSITVTKQRAQTANFTHAIYLTGLRMLVMRPTEVQSSIWAFVSPFGWKVWVILPAMFICVGLIMLYLDPDGVNYRNGKGLPVSDSMFFSFSSFFFVQESDTLRSPMARLFIGVVLFVVLILVAAYTAQLSYYLSTRQGSKPASEFSDLQAVWVGTSFGGSVYPYVTQDLGLRKVRIVHGVDDVLQALRSGRISAYIADVPFLESIAAQACDTKITGRMTYTQQYAFVTKKDSPWLDEINRAVNTLLNNGYVDLLFRKYVPNHCPDVGSIDNIKPLDFKDLISLLFLIGAASVISLLAKTYYMVMVRPKKLRRYEKIAAAKCCSQQLGECSDAGVLSGASLRDSGVSDLQDPYASHSRVAFDSRRSSALGLFRHDPEAPLSAGGSGTLGSTSVNNSSSEGSRDHLVHETQDV